MTIGYAIQRGTLIYVYDQDGRQVTSVSAPGRFPEDGLKGYTANSIYVRKGTLIYAYDENGRQIGRPFPLQHGNVENIALTKRPLVKVPETLTTNAGHKTLHQALSA
ncbi:MAG: hypothetical protein ACK4RS_04090 [Thiothrix sp.]